MVTGLLVDHAVPVPGASGNAAAVKLRVYPALRRAQNDERFGRRITVTTLPEGIDAANGRRKSVDRAVEVDRAGGTVVTGKDAEADALLRRERIANLSDGVHQFRPADLLAEVAVDRRRPSPPARVWIGHGKKKRAEDHDVKRKRGPPGCADHGAPPRAQVGDPLLAPYAARRVEHGVGANKVVAAALGNPEDDEWCDIHPTEQTEATSGSGEQTKPEPRDPQRRSEHGELELVGEEVFGSADAHVACVDVAHEIEVDEMVADLPDQVREEDEQGKADTHPEPAGAQVAARGCQDRTQDDPRDKERHGVLREYAEA